MTDRIADLLNKDSAEQVICSTYREMTDRYTADLGSIKDSAETGEFNYREMTDRIADLLNKDSAEQVSSTQS